MAELGATYDQICEQSGISPNFRGPQHVWLETVTVWDHNKLGERIEGTEREEIFAIPNEILAPAEPFTGDEAHDDDIAYSRYGLLKNGAIVSRHAEIEDGTQLRLGARSIIRPLSVVIGSLTLGVGSEVGPRTTVQNSVIERDVVTGYDNALDTAVVKRGSRLGDRVTLMGCVIAADCLLRDDVTVRTFSDIGKGSRLGEGTEVGGRCEIAEGFESETDVTVGRGSRIEPNVKVDEGITLDRGSKIKANRHVKAITGFVVEKRPKAA